jgi:signal transduction histidine kinase
MPGIASLRHRGIELAWGGFAIANLLAMWAWPGWETIPFHFIWVSLTILYGFRVWPLAATAALLLTVVMVTGVEILADAFSGTQTWGELFEVPLMSAMFLAMVWHARRRQEALDVVKRQADQQGSLLERQERFLHDASHELRTPVTIARGHLEVLRRLGGRGEADLDVALDELTRMESILDRLLLLGKADQPDFLAAEEIDLEAFLEDVFMRWSEVAPRAWQLRPVARGTVAADPEGLRIALDALLENAVKYSAPGDAIALGAVERGGDVLIEIADEGCGVPAEALDLIFERFARVDAARGRAQGGVGLGLAIVDAIAKAHGGRCEVRPRPAGSTFVLRLPGFHSRAAAPAVPSPALSLQTEPRGA